MEINRKLAIKLWDEQFGKTVGAVDFAGRKIQKGAFGQLTSAFGWCLTYVLPKSAGGKSDPENLICVHVKTASEKEENFPSFNANDVKYKLTDESGRWEIIKSEDEDALAEQEEKRARALELWRLIFGDAETALDFTGREIVRDEYGSESEGAWKVAPYVDSKPTENKNAYIASLSSIEDALGKTAFRSNGKFFTLNKEMGVYSFNETEMRSRPSTAVPAEEEPIFEFISAETVAEPEITANEPVTEEAPVADVADTVAEDIAETAAEPEITANEPVTEEAPVAEVADTVAEDTAEAAAEPEITASEPATEEAPVAEVADTVAEDTAEAAAEPEITANEPATEETPVTKVADTVAEDTAEAAAEPEITVNEHTAEEAPAEACTPEISEENATPSPSVSEANEPNAESDASEGTDNEGSDENEAEKPDIFSPLYVSELIDRTIEEYSRPDAAEAWLDFIVIHATYAPRADKSSSSALADVVSSLITSAAGAFLTFDVSELTEESGAHNTVLTYRFVSPETADMERILNTAMLLNTYASLIIKKFDLKGFKIYNYAGVFETARISYPSLTLAEYSDDFKTFMTAAFGSEPFYGEEPPSTLYVSETVSFNIPRLSEMRNDGTVYRTDARLTECNFVFGDLKERLDALNTPDIG